MSKKSDKGLQKCKYMDDLGIDITKYGTNFCDNTDRRYENWMQEKKEYGFDSRETWNLDRTMVEWVYTRFKMYLEQCEGIIDLDYYEFEFETKKGKKKTLTQKQAIKKVIKYCENYLKKDYIDAVFFPKNVWSLIGDMMPAMWW